MTPQFLRVFVIGYAPSVGRSGEAKASTGGFRWALSWEKVVEFMSGAASPGHDYRIAAIEAPAGLSGDDLTNWLDERPDLWEPPIPIYDPTTKEN